MQQTALDFDKPTTTIVTVPDADPNSVGAFVWWALSGPLSLEKLKEAWSDELKDMPLPEPPGSSTALRRAVLEQQSKRRLARPLADDRTGYALVDETNDPEKALSYSVEVQAWLEDGKLLLKPEGHALTDPLKSSYEKHLWTIGADDTRHWLSSVVLPRVLHLRLREGGGVYFVPNTYIRIFRLVVGAIKHASAHRIFAVPAQKSEDAVEGILESIQNETAYEVERMKKELQEGDLGIRAITSRLAKIEEQIRKTGKYEELLGKKQPDIQKVLEEMKAHLVEAQIRAETEKAA